MSRPARWRSLVLPVGIVMALALGVLFPAPGSALGALAVGPIDATVVSVVLIFVISGFAIHGVAVETAGFGRAVGGTVAVNLVLAPLIVAPLALWSDLPTGLVLGLAVMASVPTTLSSAAVTATVAGGDQVWAAGLTIVCVGIGSITAPLATAWLISADAAVPPGPLLARVVVMVLVPLVLGFLTARLTGWQLTQFWQLVPSLGVITLAWITVSESSDEITGAGAGRLLVIVALVLVAHLVLLGAGAAVARPFPRPQAITVLFVAAQKTLPLGLTLIAAVTAIEPSLQAAAGDAVVVCVLWHFTQLLVDGSLAARMARSGSASPPSAPRASTTVDP